MLTTIVAMTLLAPRVAHWIAEHADRLWASGGTVLAPILSVLAVILIAAFVIGRRSDSKPAAPRPIETKP